MSGIFNAAIFNNAIFNTGVVPPVVQDIGATPGFIARSGRAWRDAREKERAALEQQKTTPVSPATLGEARRAYFRQSAKLASAITERGQEIDRLRARIERLEADALAAADAERAAFEYRLLLAQQRLTLIAVQEAVLLQEIEAIDVAFIAVVMLDVTRH